MKMVLQDFIDMLSSYGMREVPIRFEIDGQEIDESSMRMCWKHESFPGDIDRVLKEDTVVVSFRKAHHAQTIE
jgi:hypothetical protein